MSKFTEEIYGSTKEILKFPDHYVALAVMVGDADVPAVDGKKIVPRGTIVGGSGGSAIDNLNKAVVEKYLAPVKAHVKLGTGDTALFVEAVDAGTDGNGITIKIQAPSTAAATATVAVSSKAITVTCAGSGDSSNITSTPKQAADAINADNAAKALVVAKAANEEATDPIAAASATNLADGAAASATGVEGVLMNDVDVTYGAKEGAMIIHGFIAVDKMPYADNALAAATVASALPMIQFIK